MIKKEFKICPVTKFIVWLILGLLVCIIGISNVFADTYSYNQFTAQLYDNFSPTLSAVTTDQTNGRWQGAIPTMTANSAGAAWGISSNMVLLANHTYTLTADIIGTYGGRLVLSTYNRIGVGTTLSNAKTSYQNNTYVTENYSRVLDNGSTIQFAFTPTTNGSYIVFPFATNYTGNNQYFYLSSYTLEDLGSSGGVTQTDINNSLNNQTNTITSNSNSNRDLIIQNQNENTQQVIDELNNCDRKTVDFTARYSGYYISWTDGSISANSSYNVSNFINIQPNTTYTINFNDITGLEYGYMCWYNDNTVVSCSQYLNMSGYASSNFNVTSPSNANKLTVTYRVNSNANVVGNICVSKLDQQTDAINGINDSINNDNVDSSSWANFFNNFTTNTFGLTSIITAPLNLIQSLTSTTCTDLQLPLPYLTNKYLTLPCMSSIYSQYFGTFFTLYQTITYGIIAYWVCVRIFNLVKDFKNPDHDEIEVVDL